MKLDEVAALITMKPAVHRLCYGSYLQSPVWVCPELLTGPLHCEPLTGLSWDRNEMPMVEQVAGAKNSEFAGRNPPQRLW